MSRPRGRPKGKNFDARVSVDIRKGDLDRLQFHARMYDSSFAAYTRRLLLNGLDRGQRVREARRRRQAGTSQGPAAHLGGVGPRGGQPREVHGVGRGAAECAAGTAARSAQRRCARRGQARPSVAQCARLCKLIGIARRKKWGIVVLDFDLNSTTPGGKLVANILMSVAEWEREIIGQRTKDALAARKAAGKRNGIERKTDDDTLARILELHSDGLSPLRIARDLDAKGVSTPNGGKRWYPSTVARLLASEQARVAS